MATVLASWFRDTIRRQLELTKLNEDYAKDLAPYMNETTTDFINALCVYITNESLKKCDPTKKTKTSSKPTIVKNANDLLGAYFEHNSNINMLAYKPTDNAEKMLGGSVGSNFAALGATFGTSAGKLFSAAAKKTGNVPTGLPALANGKVPTGLPALANAGGVKAGATITAAGADPASLMSAAQNAASTMDAGKIPSNLLDITNITSLITSTKANDVMRVYKEEVKNKLQCDEDMHGYINDHIIQPVFAVAAQNIAEVSSTPLTDLAKTTTASHLNKCILLIKSQLQIFDALLNHSSNPPVDIAIPQLIIPQYINSLFELFVYSEYGLIVGDIAIGINRDEIKKYITNLKPFNVQIDTYIKDDKYPDGVMSMNGLKLPTEWKINEADKTKLISKDIVIAEFKKLFKPVVVKAKGGRRRSRTKKHKPRCLPLAKRGSRRKHP